MNSIFEAVYDKVNETTASVHNDFYLAINGRYYTMKAPQTIVVSGETCALPFPYAVGHLITTSDNSTFTEQLDDAIFQFSLYSDDEGSAIEIGELYTKLRALMDDAILTVSDHDFISMSWRNARPKWIPGEEVWQYVVEYEIKIEQSRS